ncbi:hypothetical protein IMSAGC005_00074 [Lachnospiraceae bacterium]|nr:hypothetical protein IMSAGC005_00074 [Lachnospiraceae bacterium]
MAEWYPMENYLIGAGFDKREKDSASSWHWAVQNHAFLGIDLKNDDTEHVYRITFELLPPPNEKKREVEIYLNHVLLEKITAPMEYCMHFVGLPEKFYELEFYSGGQLIQISSDTRCFAFMLRNFKLEKTDEKLEVSEELRAIQKKQTEILAKYIEICNENNLSYFVFYGTLLGTVRHGGFIPWDDDMDVAMPRDDFKKFAQLMEEKDSEDYYIDTVENNEQVFYGGYAKFGDKRTTFISRRNAAQKTNHGIAIDIFPMDGFEIEDKKRHKQLQEIQLLQELIIVKTYHDRELLGRSVSDKRWRKIKFLSIFYSRKELAKKLALAFEENRQSDYVAILARYIREENRKFYRKEWFSDAVELQFEDLKVKVPKGYAECLRIEYGNSYLLFPNENMLKKKHGGLISTKISFSEFEKHVLFQPKPIRKLIMIGDLKIIERYLLKDRSEKEKVFIFDSNNHYEGMMMKGHMVIGAEDVKKYYDESFTILICSEQFEPFVETMKKHEINNYYVYIDDYMW